MTYQVHKKQIMAHCVYGFPTIERSHELIKTVLDQGVDYLEIQYPFTDPVADGPSITNACHTALEQKVTFSDYALFVKSMAEHYSDQTIISMTYLNPLIQQNLTKLAQIWEGSVQHLIIPDLPIEQSHHIQPLLDKGISPIWLITPGMKLDRMTLLASKTQDVLYCVTRDGVTGASDQISQDEASKRYFEHIRSIATTPFLAGFGIKTGEDARHYAAMSDGIVIGSVLLDAYRSEQEHNKGLEATKSVLQKLKDAIKS
jgi:tryptophan synthase alpha chain